MKVVSRKIILIQVLFAVLFVVIFMVFFYPKSSLPGNIVGKFDSFQETEITHALLPIISNQWYSSIFNSFPSQPLYALPLVYKLTPKGLGVSYPNIQKSSSSILGLYSEEFSVGLEQPFAKLITNAVGDWTIKTTLTTLDNQTMSSVLGHGLPFTVLNFNGGNVVSVNFAYNVTIFDPKTNKPLISSDKGTADFSADAIIISTQNHNYAFILPEKTQFALNKNMLKIQSPKKIFIGLLDKPEHFDLFKDIAEIDILDSHVNFSIDASTLSTQYSLQTNSITPLMTLYPHHFDLLASKKDILGEYQTIRGPLKLIKAQNFTTSQPLAIPPGTYQKLSKDYPLLSSQIRSDIAKVISKGPPDSKDYYLGTWFGKVASLSLLAETQNLSDQKQSLLKFIEPIFIQSLNNFEYDKKKRSLIAKNSEFGNSELNDHHFHYGYYIRTAAVLADYDISLIPKIKDKINQMVKDIASTERSGEDDPFLRNFDIYEGHSWADGYGSTASGNNQESSSEAINAWYAIYLWSKVVNDTNLERYALYLYNTEIQGAYYYWFDIKNLYNQPYKHNIASIVWGGKIDFSTWFSDETNMKYGIELLPFTPASEYLGKLPDFQKYDNDFQINGGKETAAWGDLYVMWKSFYYPTQMLSYIDKINTFQEDNTKSQFLYTLYYNQEQKVRSSNQ